MEITKEELLAYTDAATKTAAALERIADRLLDISSRQKECQQKVCVQLIDLVKVNQGLLRTIDDRTTKQANDVVWLKWVCTAFAGVGALAWTIMEILQRFHTP